MIYPLLPMYLSRVLGAGALSLGIIEGVAEAINSVLKIGSGYFSDRWTKRRPIVIAGYSISTVTRPLIAFTSIWPQVLLIRALDRTGKGIRGAPRDAMLAQFAPEGERGHIFGFHRAMDHTGAIVGPLIAAAVLFLAPGEYRLVFALTIIPGAIAVALLFLVPEAAGPAAAGSSSAAETRPTYVGRVPPSQREPALGGPAGMGAERLPRRLLAFFAVLLLFSLGNSADAFLLLRLSDELGSVTYIPLLWAGLHVVKASLSTWGGGLSDRLGRKRVIVLGWVVYAAVYAGFAVATDATVFVALFFMYGIYFALTEGAEKALVADLAPVARRGTAFGLYNAALGLGALGASVGFGLLYERVSAAAAFGTGAAVAALAAGLLVMVPTSRQLSS